MEQTFEREMDPEWVELILLAKRLGLSIEEIRFFIEQATLQNALMVP